MKAKIRKCPKCGRYTLRSKCPICEIDTKIAHPAKFSPDDPYLDLKVETLIKKWREAS